MGRARELAKGGSGNFNDSLVQDTAADVGDNILLDGTDTSATNAGFNLTLEDASSDGSSIVVSTKLDNILPNVTDLTPVTGNIVTTGDSGTITEGMFNSNFYEEGTWTPALEGLATNGSTGETTTFSEQSGTYTRIGSLVFAYCSMTTSAMVMTNDFSGFQVNGLPFTSTSTDGTNVHTGSVNGSHDCINSSMLDGKHGTVAGFQIYNTIVALTSTTGDGTSLRYAEINQNGAKTFRGSFVYHTSV